MPHLDVHVAESDLAGRETALIEKLTGAIVSVYGEWARNIAVVRLFGVPAGRWGVGGRIAEAPSPTVNFGIKEAVFERADADDILGGLVAAVTDALAEVLGEHVRAGATVEFDGVADGRTGVGGVLVTS
ncbi:tautomerase family protein [Prauserella rugosa]|uniref:Tautomerase-like protein n=1 Tax=Prauserella rugosa TaxID=43354 RepID=A0A660CHD5_9PSEU|nr:tautomerase family protein [Prauserella rugosa]KID31706.1 Tautomerase enzyme [Prauserella sp. Am3]KMS84158.1 hypothetical protein ACZ91_49300 [Streptomyces regensis]TWH21063.1 tautomerase-like protein [Prauserella rugosa]